MLLGPTFVFGDIGLRRKKNPKNQCSKCSPAAGAQTSTYRYLHDACVVAKPVSSTRRQIVCRVLKLQILSG